jgi:hypothetical protein
MKKVLILHPFLFVAYVVLFTLSLNISQIDPTQAFRPLLTLLLFATVLLFLLGALLRNWHQAGLTTFLILLLLLTYGHVYRLLGGAESMFADHRILGTIWILLFTAGMFLKWKVSDVREVTRILNIVTLVVLVFPIFNITLFFIQARGKIAVEPKSPLILSRRQPSNSLSTGLPDIYYIIVDGYGRSDVLHELYQFDNSEFISFLESRGFFVADRGRSNYVQTALSLSSSMNMEYINYLTGSVGEDAQSRGTLARMIQDSALRGFLQQSGYQMISFDTGYAPTEIKNVDLYISYQPELLSELEEVILIGSVAVIMGDKIDRLFNPSACKAQRDGIRYIFDHLSRVPMLEGPNFIFAHIMSPHPPFVFGPDGQGVKYGTCDGYDGSDFRGGQKEYVTGYAGQIAYISQLLAETIDQILTNSDIPPIIIIQGDHGPGMLLDWDSAENSCLRERVSILNAYHLPGGGIERLYDSITPVNSFRVVLNHYFDTELPLLADESYFSTWQKPYDFIDIADQIEGHCLLP